MTQAAGSRILVVGPSEEDNSDLFGLSGAVSRSLRSCGLSPEVASVQKSGDFACVVYLGSEYEVSEEIAVFYIITHSLFYKRHRGLLTSPVSKIFLIFD